jgi:hypothetical protein
MVPHYLVKQADRGTEEADRKRKRKRKTDRRREKSAGLCVQGGSIPCSQPLDFRRPEDRDRQRQTDVHKGRET